jgi:hypothetical protein
LSSFQEAAEAKALDLLAIGSWVKFTEKYTSSPRLYEKIQGLEPKRRALKKYSEFLTSRGAPLCFYCPDPLFGSGHVDHVIPWRFVAEDKVWNLVLACETCNSEKSSMTPDDQHVNEVIGRNYDLMDLDPSVLPVGVRKDLSEWRGGGLEQHFRMLLDHCRADGFGTWSP